MTGSHNLLLLEHVPQSLAGRTAVRHLLPFAFSELSGAKLVPDSLDSALFNGGYPPVYQDPTAITTWHDSYIQTYVERDVRLIQNVSDLVTFRRFLRLCAGRVGQLLDFSSIGGDAGVSHNTVRNWINILEAGFIAFRLEPYFRNFSKRIIKSPKLYFYDTGLLCRLLEIRTPRELSTHPFRGNIFENWCVVEAMKSFYNSGRRPSLYFWRDQSIEVDLLIEQSSTHMMGLECKSGATPVAEFIEPAVKLSSFAKDVAISPGVVFGGDESQMRSSGPFYGWKQFAEMLPNLISNLGQKSD